MDNNIYSTFWQENAQKENPFIAEECFCYGYNVYDDVLPNGSSAEFILLLFSQGQKPSVMASALFDKLTLFLANPGPRDPSVHAAMCSAVSKTTATAVLTSALAVGGGLLGGGHEVPYAMKQISEWRNKGIPTTIEAPEQDCVDVWLPFEHVPGFAPNEDRLSRPLAQGLSVLSKCSERGYLQWLSEHQAELQKIIGYPVATSGLAAAAFLDLGIEAYIAEQCYMMMRLPGVIAHAHDQHQLGFQKFPFFHDSLELEDDPGAFKGEVA
ncbi:MAG: citryl-CoA lyase [Gammaproteobacteria bacterium]|nr:MAG: citryl-CoA lyase [Gammaproteobacteria bacterium]